MKWPLIAILALATVVAFGALAFFKIATPSNIVGNPSDIAVVFADKWKPVKTPVPNAPKQLLYQGAFQCTLKLCEEEAMVIAAVMKAKGFLSDTPSVALASAKDEPLELTREKALDMLKQATHIDPAALEDNLRGVIVGGYHGFRTNTTLNVRGPRRPGFALEILQIRDKVLVLTAVAKDGDPDRALNRLPEMENGVWVAGKPIAH